MLIPKGIQECFFIDIYQSWKGYKTISKAVMEDNMGQWWNFSEEAGTPKLHIQEPIKEPRKRFKSLQNSLALVKVHVHDSTT